MTQYWTHIQETQPCNDYLFNLPLLSSSVYRKRCKEFERARVVYQYAISQASTLSTEEKGNEEVTELKKEFIAFEKRHGNKALIEDALVRDNCRR